MYSCMYSLFLFCVCVLYFCDKCLSDVHHFPLWSWFLFCVDWLWAHYKKKRSFNTATSHSFCYHNATSTAPLHASIPTTTSPGCCSYKHCSFTSNTCPCKDKRVVSSTTEMPHGWNLLSIPWTRWTSICDGKRLT